jgi:N-terminal TM domain of oligopeptide transport permease C
MATIVTTSFSRPGGIWLTFSKNRLAWVGFMLLAAIVFIAVFAPLIAPYDPFEQNIAARMEPPSAQFLLGTDSYGRDVLSRLIYGSRISLLVGFIAILIAMTIGCTLGIVAGYLGGLFDQLVMGLLDVMLSFPTLLLGLMIAAMLGASLQNLVIAIAITEIARADHCPEAAGFRDGWPRARLRPHPDHGHPYPSQPDLGCCGHELSLDGLGYPDRSLPELHRPWSSTADTVLGKHDPRGFREHPRRLVARGFPEPGDPGHGARTQPPGRRAS